MHPPDPAAAQPILFGKLPSQADFVRVNINDEGGLAFADWVTRSTDNLIGNGAKLPPWVSRFIYGAGPGLPVFVGALAPSRDAVGREFPVCIAAPLPAHVAAGGFAALPNAYAPFLDEATSILHEIPVLALDAVRDRLLRLRPPNADALPQAIVECNEALATETVGTFAERLFDADPGALSYALHTFASAAFAVRGVAPHGAPVVLDCPVAVDLDLLAWLTLAQRTLQWRDAVPTAYWLGGVQPRLLIALGTPTSQLLQFAVESQPRSSRLWPLSTTRTDAREAAGAALTESLRVLGNIGDASLDRLLTTLGHGTFQ